MIEKIAEIQISNIIGMSHSVIHGRIWVGLVNTRQKKVVNMGSSQKVVQSGKIWSNRTSREVLWSIMKLQKVDVGVLHIVSNDKTIDGCIALANGMYILGGSTEEGATGYAAVKQLLKLTEATFQYIDYSNSDIGELDQDLKIRVTQIINMLPNLPENMEQMQGTNTLNRIRAMDVEELAQIKKAAEAGIDQNVVQQIRSFEDKSMRWRALALWGTFAVISLGVGCMIYFRH